MKTPFLAIALALLFHQSGFGRLVPFISFEELLSNSDIVAIVSPTHNQDNDQILRLQGRDPNLFQGVTTTCRILAVFKGDIEVDSTLDIFHFRYKELSSSEPNGANFIHFPTEKIEYGFQIKDDDRVVRNSEGTLNPPRFLVFLKSDPDGRLSPTTGQYDSSRSVILLFDTFFFGYPLSQ